MTVSIDDVRRTCGLTSTEIDDADVQQVIEEAEAEVSRLLNTSLTPKTVIEVHDGDELGEDSEILLLDHTPVLQIAECKIAGTTVSPKYIHIYKDSGKIVLDDSAEETKFDDDDPKTNVIKYTYGLLEETATQTTTSAAVSSPTTNYSLGVASVTGLADNDWIQVVGMDGSCEITQIENTPANGSFQCDLVLLHENGSIVTKMDAPPLLDRFVQVVASLMLVAREVGQSYDDIVGYSYSGLQVQLGEPYTQWRETALQLRKEYDELRAHYRQKPVVG